MSKTSAQVNEAIALRRGWVLQGVNWIARNGTPSWDERPHQDGGLLPDYCSKWGLAGPLLGDGAWLHALTWYEELPDGTPHSKYWVAWGASDEATEQKKGAAVLGSEATARAWLAVQEGADNNEPPFDQF